MTAIKTFQKTIGVLDDGIVGPITLSVADTWLQQQIWRRGWRFPKKGLVWVRQDNKFTNTFDDVVLVYSLDLKAVLPCSTTSGFFWIYNPLTVGGITGTAVSIEQQVLNAHRFVTGSNWKTLWLQMPYFQQVQPITVYRDNNKNLVLDKMQQHTGLFGINYHRGGWTSFIDRWSAGCHIVEDKNWTAAVVPHFSLGEFIDHTVIETY